MSEVVTFEQLCKASGYSDPISVRTWMARNGIKSIEGKHGRPCTTLKQLDAAMEGDINISGADDLPQVVSA